MKRKLQNPKPETSKPARMEPMAEGVQKKPKRRNWLGIDNRELVAHAKKFIAERGIIGRRELAKADKGMYRALWRRELLNEIGLEKKLRDWIIMERNGLISYARGFVAEKRVGGRKELAKTDAGLYQALRKRNLLDEVGLPDLRGVRRNWAGMDNGDLVAFAKNFIAERGIIGRAELAKADSGLYNALGRRKLLDEAELPNLKKSNRNWIGMGKYELVAFAKRFIAERGIIGRAELEKADSGLYRALKKRELLDELELEEKQRYWAGMDNGDLVAFAKRFIEERGIGGRAELEEADSGLYNALGRRKLLDAVFSDAESARHADAVAGVLGALGSFGDGK